MEGPPSSWLLIRPGWKVYASDGQQIGEVAEVTGDDTKDIFDGIALATTALGKPRYLPAEQVTEIREGSVHLRLSHDQVEALGEYREPASSVQIESDNRTGAAANAAADVRELASKVARPLQRDEQSVNIWRRMYLLLRRAIGR